MYSTSFSYLSHHSENPKEGGNATDPPPEPPPAPEQRDINDFISEGCPNTQ